MDKIFDWSEEDFDNDVIGFFIKYADGDLKKKLLDDRDNIKVKYPDYDSSLNAK